MEIIVTFLMVIKMNIQGKKAIKKVACGVPIFGGEYFKCILYARFHVGTSNSTWTTSVTIRTQSVKIKEFWKKRWLKILTTYSFPGSSIKTK